MNRFAFCLLLVLATPAFGQEQWWTAVESAVPKAAAAGYAASAATFAGDSQCWLELDGEGGATDSATGTISFWWNPGTGDATVRAFLENNGRCTVQRTGGDNSVRIALSGTAGASEVELRQNTATVAALTSTSGWTWIAADWDNNTAGACHLYIANAATSWVATDCTTRTDDTGGGNVIDWTRFDFGIGATVGGVNPANGCLSEFYLSNTRQDLSQSANRDKFYNSTTHKPAGDLTSIGSPMIYLKGDGTGFTVNSGSIGNFTKYGTTALTSCTGP